jgi:hypothetical protein
MVRVASDGGRHDNSDAQADPEQHGESLPHRLLPWVRHLGHWHGGYAFDIIGAPLVFPGRTVTLASSRTTAPVLVSTSYTRIVMPMVVCPLRDSERC